MTWLLLPGLRLARRDADHLQLGVDAPRVAVLPDTRAVRRLVADLAHGAPLTTLDETTAPVLTELVRAGLVVAADDEAARRRRRGRSTVHVDAPDDVRPAALRLVEEAGLATTPTPSAATVALVWTEGELARDRLDGWVRAGHAAPRGRRAARRPPPRSVRRARRHRLPALRRRARRRGRPAPRAGGRAGRHRQAAASGPPRLRPCAPWRWPGRCTTWPRRPRAVGPAPGRPPCASTRCRRCSRRTAGTRTAAAPGPTTCSAPARPGRLTSTRCRACPPSRAGARASSCSQ